MRICVEEHSVNVTELRYIYIYIYILNVKLRYAACYTIPIGQVGEGCCIHRDINFLKIFSVRNR